MLGLVLPQQGWSDVVIASILSLANVILPLSLFSIRSEKRWLYGLLAFNLAMWLLLDPLLIAIHQLTVPPSWRAALTLPL